MSPTGRNLDAIWAEFDKIAPNKAKCRSCQYECAPLVDRLKKHFSKVHASEQGSGTAKDVKKNDIFDKNSDFSTFFSICQFITRKNDVLNV